MRTICVGFLLGLLFGCGGDSGDDSTADAPIADIDTGPCTATTGGSLGSVTVSGRATYDLLRHNPIKLDKNNPVKTSIRGARVELVNNDTGATIASTDTDANGNYSFASIPVNSNVKIRVKTQLLKSGTPSWNFQVVNHAVSGKPVYSMVSNVFNTNASNQTCNVNADSGWNGTAWTNRRAGGAFAILDSAYKAKEKILLANANFQFTPTKFNWHINEVEISHFNPTTGELTIMGNEKDDHDEYDDHVVIHEWGHYFENFHSRSDSVGGPHGPENKLDIRVAFGEGFGNAWSGIATDDPLYVDFVASDAAGGFSFSVETNGNDSVGWVSEENVQSVLYDLYDSGTETNDGVALGITPIYNVLVDEQKNTDAFTSIFSFMETVVAENVGSAAAINTMLGSRAISTPIDRFASTETIGSGGVSVYRSLIIGSPTPNICSNASNGSYNKQDNRRYLKLVINSAGTYRISVAPASTTSDPDFYVFNRGIIVGDTAFEGADSGTNQTEHWEHNLSAGTYVIDLHEYLNVDNISGNELTSCFTVSVQQI